MQACIVRYVRLGYEPIAQNVSGIGSEVLRHPTLHRVVKFSQDPAYDVFASYAMASPSDHFPRIYKHERPAGPFTPTSNHAFTLTEMEVLVPLLADEESNLSVWVTAVFDAKRHQLDPTAVPDPYGLTADFLCLIKVASENPVNIDLLKLSNYMARDTGRQRQIVFTDPYN